MEARKQKEKKGAFWASASFPRPAVGGVAGRLSAPDGTTTTAHHNAAFEGDGAGGEPTHLCPGEDAAPLRNLGGE